jgi:hypothetical protein
MSGVSRVLSCRVAEVVSLSLVACGVDCGHATVTPVFCCSMVAPNSIVDDGSGRSPDNRLDGETTRTG